MRWRLMIHSSPIYGRYVHDFSPKQLFPIQRSHLVLSRNSQMCRTFVSVWDLQCSHSNYDLFWKFFSMNTVDSIVAAINFCQIINVLLHLQQHWKFFPVFFALDHWPDPRIILFLPTIPILFLSFPSWNISKKFYQIVLIDRTSLFHFWEDQARSWSNFRIICWGEVLHELLMEVMSGGLE